MMAYEVMQYDGTFFKNVDASKLNNDALRLSVSYAMYKMAE